MDRLERIVPSNIPKAIGPYFPVTAFGDLIFVSGQIPINPQTGNIDQDNIEWQTHQVMKNLKNAVEGSDSSLNLVTKATILLTDLNNFGKVNDIYASYFEQGRYPARVCYQVSALPRGSLVEIDAIAVRTPIGDTLKKKIKE